MKHKEKVILVGPFLGELYWEFFRFAPYVFYKQKQMKNIPLVVLTRPDRYDIYGKRCIKFNPLNLKNDGITRFAECFRMMNFSNTDYEKIIKTYYIQELSNFDIVSHIYPPFTKPYCLDKDYYPLNQRIFKYKVRDDNKILIEEFLKDVKKPIVILAPRFRKNFKRNWPYWNDLYDKIEQTKWIDKIEFIICGKDGEYIPDKKNRFKDINDIKLTENSSLFGLLLELMRYNKLTIGSQSAIPNISLLYKKPVIEWGNQKHLHTVTYNIFNTPVIFFDSPNFKIPIDKMFNKIVIELSNLLI